MKNNNFKIIRGDEISEILNNKEDKITQLIEEAYVTHHKNESELPHSIFLKFKKQPQDRIIGLPAYLGGNQNIAGFKWISSFPGNITNGIDRASAMLVLNSMDTGRPKAVLESSIISAKRTASSAALASKKLIIYTENSNTLSLVGCGFIGYETIRFILSQVSTIKEIVIHDLSHERANFFKQKAEKEFKIQVSIVTSLDNIFSKGGLVVLSTTSAKPYIDENINIHPKSIILNISLRDISPDIIAESINIVDDFDHVNRADTSIHLATKKYGHSKFCVGNIANLINGEIKELENRNCPIIFNPFGLGVLDIILGDYCLIESNNNHIGSEIESFFPIAWNDKKKKEDIFISKVDELLKFRHACKIFDETKVISDIDIKSILNAGIQSPSSFGQEPWKFLVVRNKELKEKIYTISCQQQQITSCSHLVILLSDTESIKPESGIPKKMFSRFNYSDKEVNAYLEYYTQHLKDTFSTQEGRYNWSTKQTYIAASNMMMSAADKKIDSCPIEGFNKKKLEELLNLKDTNFEVSLMLPFGYRLNKQPKRIRKEYNSVIEFLN